MHLYLQILISTGATVKLPGVVMGYDVLGDSDVTGVLPNTAGIDVHTSAPSLSPCSIVLGSAQKSIRFVPSIASHRMLYFKLAELAYSWQSQAY